VAGQQIVTRERLEVLALFAAEDLESGRPLDQTIEEIQRLNALAVLSWSPGKWWGRRGEVVSGAVRKASPRCLCVGDIRGRPPFWPSPSVFAEARKKGMKILRGSDPLDFANEQDHVGGYGFCISEKLDAQHPAEHLKSLIGSAAPDMQPYGRRIGTVRFIRNQAMLRYRKARTLALQHQTP